MDGLRVPAPSDWCYLGSKVRYATTSSTFICAQD